MTRIKLEKIAQLMFDVWSESDNLTNPIMAGEYIAKELSQAINSTILSVAAPLDCELDGFTIQGEPNDEQCNSRKWMNDRVN
ncbi:hypothetical protein [Patiriisocius sp. Uisw_047]|jgi:hypothetical protein|uniref:hypothetical protein n=1 Tax=Patiriisocius sp. Uisw_047 TaxID=3230969 RepID=UPI0039EB5A6B